jgi:iron complex transport system substrate-binding protein
VPGRENGPDRIQHGPSATSGRLGGARAARFWHSVRVIVRDDLGRAVDVPRAPRRVVSLCPSTTETLFALGLGDGRLVGRTDWCRHPRGRVEALASVGGTKKVRSERVAALDPDLIVAVREENDREQIESLAATWPVFVLDPVDVESAIQGVDRLGDVVGAGEIANRLATRIRAAFADLPRAPSLRVAYLIWRKPWMVVGKDTYVDDVLRRLGLVNVGADLEGRYPETDAAALRRARVELLLASSEPFPFDASYFEELRTLVPEAAPVLVDGEAFSWHGARMLEAAVAFRELVPRLVAAASKARGSDRADGAS